MKIQFVVSLLLFASLCYGAENESSAHEFGGQGRRGMSRGEMGRGRMGRGGMSRGGMMQNRFMSEIEIAKKFPKEYAEIDALREKYEAELAVLAEKAGVKLPGGMDSAMRQLRKLDPVAFDSAAEKMKTSPREGMGQIMELAKKHGISLFPGRPDGMIGQPESGVTTPAPRKFNRPDMGALRRKYPEKMQEYDKLRSGNPEKARKMLLEIIEMDKSDSK